MALCAAKGGFLATPHDAQSLQDIQRQYPVYADTQDNFYSILIGGSDAATPNKWVWKDGPLTDAQLWQGLSTGTPRNNFPSSSWRSGEPNHWDNSIAVEHQMVINYVGMADCDVSSCGYKCYACQFTGCDATTNPCNATNTLSMSGSDYSNCNCNCKPGYGGQFCECPLGPCSPRGGVMSSTITAAEGTVCTCSCRPTYGGVNCDEHTNTSTTTITPSTPITTTKTVELTASLSAVVSNTTTMPLTQSTLVSKSATAALSLSDVHNTTTTTWTASGTVSISSPPTHSPTVVRPLTSLRTHQTSCPETIVTVSIVKNGTNGGAVVVVVPAGGLTDFMIRSGGVVVNISISSSVDMSIEFASPSIFNFGVESLGVSDPRSYPSVVNLADIQCAFHPDTHRTVLCELPSSPDYAIREAESLRITAPSSTMLNVGPCGSATEVLIGTVSVSPATVDKLSASLQAAFTVVTAVSTVVISILGDGSPIETQVLVMILDSPCAASYDRKSIEWVRYIVMPGATLGPIWTMGINIMIAVGVVVLHCIAVVVMSRIKGDAAASQQVRTSLMFPGISVSVAQVMYAGVMYGTMSILRTERGAAGAATIGGLVYMMVVPSVVVYLLAYQANVLYYPYDWKVEGVPKKRRWLYPHGFWSPKGQMFRLFSVVGPYRMGMHYAALFPFLFALTIAIFTAALPETILCDYLYVAVGVAGIVLGLATLVGNPMRSRLQSIITAACLALLGVLAILQIVAIRTNSETIVIAKGTCNYVLITLLTLRACHSVFIFVFEFRSKDELIAKMRDRGALVITEEEDTPCSRIRSAPTDSEMSVSECTTTGGGGTAPHVLCSSHNDHPQRKVEGGPYLMSTRGSHSFTSDSVANTTTSPKSEAMDFQAPPVGVDDRLVSSCSFNACSTNTMPSNIVAPSRGWADRSVDSGRRHRDSMPSIDAVPVAGPGALQAGSGTLSLRRGSLVSSSSLGTSFNMQNHHNHLQPSTPMLPSLLGGGSAASISVGSPFNTSFGRDISSRPYVLDDGVMREAATPVPQVFGQDAVADSVTSSSSPVEEGLTSSPLQLVFAFN